jgi:SOS-response transcriptional repressor LexA
MPLTAAHRCQFCGDVLFHDDFFSDPSQHFCLTVNGPGMINPDASGSDIVSPHAAY